MTCPLRSSKLLYRVHMSRRRQTVTPLRIPHPATAGAREGAPAWRVPSWRPPRRGSPARPETKLIFYASRLQVRKTSVLLRSQPGSAVQDLNVELLGPLDNALPLLARDVVRNLRRIRPVVHHEELDLLHVVHEEFVETVRQQVTSALVRAWERARERKRASATRVSARSERWFARPPVRTSQGEAVRARDDPARARPKRCAWVAPPRRGGVAGAAARATSRRPRARARARRVRSP